MLQYKAPNDEKSSIDMSSNSEQMNTFFWLRKALIEAAKEQYFTQLADTTTMPKHYGKTLKKYHYMPLLDDRNINDQGIDANGVTIADGNLYGSTKDIGRIVSKLPMLSETGGRVNRVGFSRFEIEGSIVNMGYFTEFTQDALDFDSDPELMSHLSRELVTAASEMSEDILQIDLLTGAGTVYFTGDATADDEISGEGTAPSVFTYEDLMRLGITLDDNRTPKQTKVITGSRMVDTRTISNGRVAYIGSELIPTIRKMKDLHGDAAFIPVHMYAAGGTVLRGEIGSVDQFRFVVVPEMLHWAGAGAAVTNNAGYREEGGRYNIYPILVVGNESFSTIGFQTTGASAKFNVITRMPGKDQANRSDPYGKMGFSSIQWWYGSLLLRPERIAIMKTVAEI